MAASDRQATGVADEIVLQLWPSPDTVGRARHAIGEFCRSGAHANLADDAELLTSELVTNACRHSAGQVTVLALRNEARVVVTVTDDDTAHRPQLILADSGQDHGRGLMLVDALAGAWGTTAHAGGKSVWFRLP